MLELIVVIVIIGVLATLGFNQYRQAIENARGAEGRSVLSTLRSSQIAYHAEHTDKYAELSEIGGTSVPSNCQQVTNYYSYSCDTATGTCTATRCTSGGKPPPGSLACSISLPINDPLTESCEAYGG